MKIAIIGSGISGMYAAWKLASQHEVTLYEKNSYFGGHTDTHQFCLGGKQVAVDSGFIVFNEYNYPLFSQMLSQLGVAVQKSNMSFSVNNLVTGLQYNPSKKWSLVTRPQNLLKKSFRLMLSDLLRFYEQNKNIVLDDYSPDYTLEEYLDEHGYSEVFRQEHLYPMCGALWSSPIEQIGRIPYKFVVSFFQHHRMLQLKERPEWLTVQGGAAQYIEAIRTQCPTLQWKNAEVLSVKRGGRHVEVRTAEQTEHYDRVIFASHADDTLQLLEDPTEDEIEVLFQFGYQDNRMVVHTDQSIMPKQKSQWASWHVHVTQDEQDNIHYGFSYWMNNLQKLECKPQVFATLNPNLPIRADKILVERHYRHPVFDQQAIKAQSKWYKINGVNNTLFCGAYWGWGFHEDGARSAERVVQLLSREKTQSQKAYEHV